MKSLTKSNRFLFLDHYLNDKIIIKKEKSNNQKRLGRP